MRLEEDKKEQYVGSMASPIQKYMYALLVPTHTSTLQHMQCNRSFSETGN